MRNQSVNPCSSNLHIPSRSCRLWTTETKNYKYGTCFCGIEICRNDLKYILVLLSINKQVLSLAIKPTKQSSLQRGETPKTAPQAIYWAGRTMICSVKPSLRLLPWTKLSLRWWKSRQRGAVARHCWLLLNNRLSSTSEESLVAVAWEVLISQWSTETHTSDRNKSYYLPNTK